MKIFLPLLIAFAALFALHCDDDDDWFPTNTTEAGVIGNWEGTSDEDEVDFLYTIGSNYNYTYTATSGSDIVEQQSGSWAVNGSEITFSPEVCTSIDDENDSPTTVECDDSYTLTVPDGNTWALTAGSYGEIDFTKK